VHCFSVSADHDSMMGQFEVLAETLRSFYDDLGLHYRISELIDL
jgi:hypothetical protein